MSSVAKINSDLSKKGSVQQIGQQLYYIEVVMYNSIDGEKPFYVPFFMINSLEINESMHTWATKGSLTLLTQFESISRGNPTKLSEGTANYEEVKEIIKAPYIERTDGRNRVSIKIFPINGQTENDLKISDKPRKQWEINHDFIITQVVDLDVNNTQDKKRQYFLINERHQFLTEKNLSWSTALIASNKLGNSLKPWELTDNEASLTPNEVLLEFLTIAGKDQKTSEQIKIGFDDNGTIDNPNIPFNKVIEDEWDVGMPENKMLYYSPANANGLEDLHYILARCTDQDGFPVILDYGRSVEDKGWKLTPLSRYFEKSIDISVERLELEVGTEPKLPPIPRGPTNDSTNTQNFFSAVASRISKYRFTPMACLDDNRITNSPLHYFNHATGEFVIKFAKNTANMVIDTLQKFAEKGLYSYKNNSGKGAQIILNLNKTKQLGEMLTNEFSSAGQFTPETAPLNQMILDAVFLNQIISFQSIGLTIRTPGVFINIFRSDATDSNPFDDRFLGQWLVIKTNHMFTQKDYKTEIIAVKIDSFSKIFPQIDDK
jgi:hypothetical protein